jgi:hypothetical protein
MRLSLLLLAVVLFSCSDDERAPISPGGGGAHPVGEVRRDGGGNVDDDDAGSTSDGGMAEGAMAFECTRIDAVMFSSDEIPSVTSTSSPSDFRVTRQVATWRDGCDSPTILLELSNGVCPSGQGHELEISLSVNAIEDGTIGLGLTEVRAESEAMTNEIRVRYTRPHGFSPEGVYGTCDGSSGTLSFYDAPDATRPNNFRARYEFILTSCDDKRNPTQVVSGYFDVRLRRTLAETCPP